GPGSPGREPRRVGLEPLTAPVGAEPEGTAGVPRVCGGVGRLDLHPAHRVEGVAPAAPEPVPVAVEPVQDGEHAEEDDVQHGRVVPLEVGGDDGFGPAPGYAPGQREEPLDDET